MDTREKCTNLISRLYKGVLFRDLALHTGISAQLRKGARILDAGCGLDAPIASRHAQDVGLAAGVDMVETYEPPRGVRIVRGNLDALPFKDQAFDLVFSRSVLEHLPCPGRTFKEIARIVQPGGKIIMVTPNKYDYASILARLIPNALHGSFLRTCAGEDVYDNFPTYFRCNTRRAIKKTARAAGLRPVKINYLRHYPYYLMFSLPLFYLGVAYDRIITRLHMGFLQPSIYLELERPE
jgi:SAM-dependent methyltransferase